MTGERWWWALSHCDASMVRMTVGFGVGELWVERLDELDGRLRELLQHER